MPIPSASRPSLVSWAGNAQDVVLWRALGDLPSGRCAELVSRSGEPATVTRALVESGWQGCTVARPADLPVDGPELHVLSVDDPELLAAALRALGDRQPWVLVVTAAGTAPGQGRRRPPAVAGYLHVLYDGVSDFLLHDDHQELAPALDHAACSRDAYSTPAERGREADLARWRARALQGWEQHTASPVLTGASLQLKEMRESTSWRVTAPLRAVTARLPHGLRG